MTEFTLLKGDKSDPGLPWGGYDFAKKSLAVVVNDMRGDASILWTVGAHLQMEIDEAGLGFEDLGLEPPDDRLWIWEGKSVYCRDAYTGETDFDLNGEWRRPTEPELMAILRGDCPWDDAEWKLCLCGNPEVVCPKHQDHE